MVTEHKMWVLIFFTTFVWNISHSKRQMIGNELHDYTVQCTNNIQHFHFQLLHKTLKNVVTKIF